MPSASRVFVWFLACLFLGTSLTVAQEETDNAATPAKEDGGLAEWDRLIYVPFKELQKVFDNQDASAVIPYAEYLELLKTYMNRDNAAAKSPDAVITSSAFTGQVEKDVVRLQAEFRITVLKEDGWAHLPVTFGQSAVGKVTSSDEKNVLLRGVGNGKYELLLKTAGQQTVTVELLAAVKTSPENRSFVIECPAVGISELTLTIPEPEQSVEIAPLQVLLPTEGDNKEQTVVKASLGATERFEVRWNPEAGSKPIMDLLTSATNRSQVNVESGLIQSTTSLTYEVLRGELTAVTVMAPADARIIDVVSSAGRIRSWKAEAVGETHQAIQIELLTPVTDRFQVDIQSERTPDSDTFQLIGKSDDGRLHGIHADGVVRESGQIGLTTDSSLTMVVKSQSGVKRIGSGEVNKGGPPTSSQVWEFSGTTGSLVVQTRPVEPRLLVDQATRIIFDDDELKLATTLTYTVERAGVFQLNLSYPESLTIDTVRADGMSEFNVDRDAGQLTLSLTQKRLGKIAVNITAHQAFDATAEGTETDVPTITPLNVEREDGRLEVFAPQFLDVVTIDEKLSGLFPTESNTANVGRAVRVSSWKYTQRPFALAVRTTPRPAQLAASVATTASVEPDVMKVSSVLTYSVRNAGIDTYRIAVPEAIADDIRFRSLNPGHTIQQRDKATEAVDGWVTWTLILQDEITGTIQLAADWEVPLEELKDATVEQTLRLEPVRVLLPFTGEQADKRKVTLNQTRGEIRLLRHESLSISADGEGDTMEKIDVRELELMPQTGYQAFRYFAQPVSADIAIRKHEIHKVVETVVARAAVEIVTDKQRLANYRCRCRITSSQRQRLRIDLPVEAELQAPMLNSRRTTFEEAGDVELSDEDGWKAYYVNISREGTSDEEFLLLFQFRCPIAGDSALPYEGRGRRQLLRLPRIGDDSGSTVVQQSRVAVWTPKDISLVGEPENWSVVGRYVWNLWKPLLSPTAPAEAESLNSWIGGVDGASEFARQGNVSVYRALGRRDSLRVTWWNRPFLVAIISAALLIVGLILRRTSWENRITLTVIGCLVVALWALNDSSEALQFASAGSLGMVAVAGVWLAGLLLGNQRPSTNGGARGNISTDDRPNPPNPPTEPPAAEGTPPAGSPPAVPTITPAVSPSPDVTRMMNDLTGGK
ncbi:MAG: hypothetical protein R3C59_19535 [Planctomycetaceae bacterium]